MKGDGDLEKPIYRGRCEDVEGGKERITELEERACF